MRSVAQTSHLYSNVELHPFKVVAHAVSGTWKRYIQGGFTLDRYNGMLSFANIGTYTDETTWTTLNTSNHLIIVYLPLNSPGSRNIQEILGSTATLWTTSEYFYIPIAKVTWSGGIPTIEQFQFGNIDLLGAQKLDGTQTGLVSTIIASYANQNVVTTRYGMYLGYTSDGKIKLLSQAVSGNTVFTVSSGYYSPTSEWRIDGGYLQVRYGRSKLHLDASNNLEIINSGWTDWQDIISVGDCSSA